LSHTRDWGFPSRDLQSTRYWFYCNLYNRKDW